MVTRPRGFVHSPPTAAEIGTFLIGWWLQEGSAAVSGGKAPIVATQSVAVHTADACRGKAASLGAVSEKACGYGSEGHEELMEFVTTDSTIKGPLDEDHAMNHLSRSGHKASDLPTSHTFEGPLSGRRVARFETGD
ncbi:hypothetical protein K490DRAFT_59417 [Saccharata proteae CBS 121410]|uniref:Uncharacterized protein n=1 Tax=Saccharata proteae CBS 121410 TaxID=1314787 RepID=A0A9P4HQ53_9PEZI|nr:hypothetical protein K490DRAFT_59417 [Saccharata proteae CBS 121410]